MPGEKTEVTATANVSLREVNADTVGAVCGLSNTLTEPKKNFVANNAFSIAQAYFEPKAWFRAIYADEEPVGFVMLHDDAEQPEYFLWRFMNARYTELLRAGVPVIDGAHQVLRQLHGTVRMGIVTSSRRQHFEIIHAATGLLDCIRRFGDQQASIYRSIQKADLYC